MIRDGKREADAAIDLIPAAVWGQTVQRVAKVFALIPPSSALSAFNTSDSETEIESTSK